MALSMPITRPNLPSITASQPNGAVDPRHLAPVESGSTDIRYFMLAVCALAMRAMHFAARVEAKIILKTTGRYRDLWGQWSIFGGNQARYEPCTYAQYVAAKLLGRAKYWAPADRAAVQARLRLYGHAVTIPDSSYWRKKRNADGTYPATAAVPGTSNHGEGCADDLAAETDGDPGPEGLTTYILQWLYGNAFRFGYAWETKSEQWHVHWIAGDGVPQDVTRYLNAIGAPVIQEGSTGDYVRWYQALLNNKGANLVADGIFGPRTTAATLWCQGVWGLPQTGVVNADTWWMVTG